MDGKFFSELLRLRSRAVKEAKRDEVYSYTDFIDPAIVCLIPVDAVKPGSWTPDDWQYARMGYVRRKRTRVYMEVA